ncbi:MAG: hypothetical protein LCH39_15005, partial [Proteobacteria bacterium]|nr:hypothetical protein [Pseudomonadota bacterium]
MIRTLMLGTGLIAASATYAADLGAKKPTPAAATSTMCKERRALPADAFGFATGSDVADMGSWGVGLDTAGSKGYRGATAGTISPTLQVSGSFFPCLEVGPYVTYGH